MLALVGVFFSTIWLYGCDGSTPISTPSSDITTPATAGPAEGKADRFTIASGTASTFPAPGVLTNDYIPPGVALRTELASKPSAGLVTLESDGGFSYTPAADFSGIDRFTYVLTDGANVSDQVEVVITLPNIIVFLVDDMGQGDTPVYNSGAAIPTPNMTALAEAGIRFTQAHSPAALCAPSRYSILTGNQAFRGRRSYGVQPAYDPETMILPNQLTLGNLFQQAGYKTAFIGKVHNGGAFWNLDGSAYTSEQLEIDFTRPYDRGPTQLGFDYSFTLPSGLSAGPYAFFENDRLVRYDELTSQFVPFIDSKKANESFRTVVSFGSYNGGNVWVGGYALDNYDSRTAGPVLTRKAIDFIDSAIADNNPAMAQPFFLYFPAPQPHIPWTPPPYFNLSNPYDVDDNIDGIPVKDQTPISTRTDAIYETDVMLGLLIDHLTEKGILDNTVIIFSSDNGARDAGRKKGDQKTNERREAGKRSNQIHFNAQGIEDGTPLRGKKGSIYEGGHRIPLIASWGDGVHTGNGFSQGISSSQLVGLQDLAATFSELIGTPLPAGQFNDSISFLTSSHQGENSSAAGRNHMIIQGSPRSAGETNNGVARIDRAYYRIDSNSNIWKLSVNSDTFDPAKDIVWKELYQLSNDPGEEQDLYDNPDVKDWRDLMQTEYLDLINQKLAQ